MKVLVYMEKNRLAPVGGPRGYNYNLANALNNLNITNIDYIVSNKEPTNSRVNKIVDKVRNQAIKGFLILCKSIANRIFIIYGKSLKPIVRLDDYDVIHFHNPLEMYQIRDSLANYKGKVILTSHSPTLSSAELIDTATTFEKKYMADFYKKLEKVDIYAFERADYIIFPCEEAEEPYYHSWDFYKDFKKRNENKYKYLLTGITPCAVTINRNIIRKKYNIPDDAFVISYVGRHNTIKGYDSLKKICKQVLDLYENVYVIVTGKEGPLYRLEHPRWIEIGWTKDPHSVIGASDIFVLPNKETYFDLILLEVLSLGKVVIASNTGGNRYFQKIHSKSIYLYETDKEAIDYMKMIISMPVKQREDLGQINKSLFFDKFTCETFAKGYLKILNEIGDS